MRERLAALLDGALYDLDTGPDRYCDGVIGHLEQRVADLLGKPDAAFFPTGTMAQQVGLRCWAARTANPVVALHPLAHLEKHERGALPALTGLRTVHLTSAPRPPDAAQVRDIGEPFGTLVLELPLRDAGFLLPTWDELVSTVQAARDRDAVVHFDGARLWECPPHFGVELSEIAELADSVYVSFYKSLEGLSGAALAGPAELIADARTWRHRYGGQLYHQFPVALAALAGLEHVLPRLPAFVAHAAAVADGLRRGFDQAAPWARVHPAVPHTHQFTVHLPFGAQALNEAVLRHATERGTSLFRSWRHRRPAGVDDGDHRGGVRPGLDRQRGRRRHDRVHVLPHGRVVRTAGQSAPPSGGRTAPR